MRGFHHPRKNLENLYPNPPLLLYTPDMNIADVRIPDSTSRYSNISLAKLCGKTIADIECSLSREFGQVNVKLYRIVFTDGTTLYCEGEHDMPYVTDSTEPVLPKEEILNQLYKEQ